MIFHHDIEQVDMILPSDKFSKSYYMRVDKANLNTKLRFYSISYVPLQKGGHLPFLFFQ